MSVIPKSVLNEMIPEGDIKLTKNDKILKIKFTNVLSPMSLDELAFHTLQFWVDDQSIAQSIIDGIKIKCRLLVQTINRTNKFDDLCLPIYFIESNLDVKVNLPPKIEKIIENKLKCKKSKSR